ncbi:hypothetical protein PPYR_02847 [Photinus pyralis]|uniref:GTP:AMP phosphotransferase, mitochondrial n=1 Tax=Photinus pyralis TaxID=7054 RepID=A0A1Y1NEA7_PHOPY|nr:GTP:AMP phosphotransferase AK3, mitochondrial-like [Photinus pyralis]KAB0791047.1 hypothetical protein PPYR_02847 [Photinus pyralis]
MAQLFKAVILGAPASGKGTISSRIISKFNFEHISVGDRLRLQIKNKTPLGTEAKQYIDRGTLVPDTLMTKFVAGELAVVNKSWLLDGFPRTLAQAHSLWDLHKLDIVINLDVPFDVIVDRAKGRWIHLASGRVYNSDFNAPKVFGKDDVTGEALVQREDDRPDVVRRRLDVYREVTRPVIEFYQKVDIVQNFEGRTSDEIWPKVVDCLNAYVTDKKIAAGNV